MYEIMRRPERRHADDEASAFDAPDGIRLRMRENRSRLTQHGRETFTVLILLFMAMAILPALQGRWLVPLFALSTMAALGLALEWHQRNPPPEEWLELSDGRFVWRGRSRAVVDLPSYWLRFELERRGPTDCRLVFHHRMQRFEVGHCLNLDERREIAPILARALAASNHMR